MKYSFTLAALLVFAFFGRHNSRKPAAGILAVAAKLVQQCFYWVNQEKK